jgi:predicted enzyme related to lactoylglutathione lyase
MKKMNPVVHFELPVEDRDRASDFYTNAFGWEAQKFGPEMGNYTVVATSERGENDFPKNPGMINGGLFQKSSDNQYPSVVIAVDDIHEAMKAVEDAGGEVLGGSQGKDKPDDIPGVGLYSAIIDTEGNRVGVLQPNQM